MPSALQRSLNPRTAWLGFGLALGFGLELGFGLGGASQEEPRRRTLAPTERAEREHTGRGGGKGKGRGGKGGRGKGGGRDRNPRSARTYAPG